MEDRHCSTQNHLPIIAAHRAPIRAAKISTLAPMPIDVTDGRGGVRRDIASGHGRLVILAVKRVARLETAREALHIVLRAGLRGGRALQVAIAINRARFIGAAGGLGIAPAGVGRGRKLDVADVPRAVGGRLAVIGRERAVGADVLIGRVAGDAVGLGGQLAVFAELFQTVIGLAGDKTLNEGVDLDAGRANRVVERQAAVVRVVQIDGQAVVEHIGVVLDVQHVQNDRDVDLVAVAVGRLEVMGVGARRLLLEDQDVILKAGHVAVAVGVGVEVPAAVSRRGGIPEMQYRAVVRVSRVQIDAVFRRELRADGIGVLIAVRRNAVVTFDQPERGVVRLCLGLGQADELQTVINIDRAGRFGVCAAGGVDGNILFVLQIIDRVIAVPGILHVEQRLVALGAVPVEFVGIPRLQLAGLALRRPGAVSGNLPVFIADADGIDAVGQRTEADGRAVRGRGDEARDLAAVGRNRGGVARADRDRVPRPHEVLLRRAGVDREGRAGSQGACLGIGRVAERAVPGQAVLDTVERQALADLQAGRLMSRAGDVLQEGLQRTRAGEGQVDLRAVCLGQKDLDVLDLAVIRCAVERIAAKADAVIAGCEADLLVCEGHVLQRKLIAGVEQGDVIIQLLGLVDQTAVFNGRAVLRRALDGVDVFRGDVDVCLDADVRAVAVALHVVEVEVVHLAVLEAAFLDVVIQVEGRLRDGVRRADVHDHLVVDEQIDVVVALEGEVEVILGVEHELAVPLHREVVIAADLRFEARRAALGRAVIVEVRRVRLPEGRAARGRQEGMQRCVPICRVINHILRGAAVDVRDAAVVGVVGHAVIAAVKDIVGVAGAVRLLREGHMRVFRDGLADAVVVLIEGVEHPIGNIKIVYKIVLMAAVGNLAPRQVEQTLMALRVGSPIALGRRGHVRIGTGCKIVADELRPVLVSGELRALNKVVVIIVAVLFRDGQRLLEQLGELLNGLLRVGQRLRLRIDLIIDQTDRRHALDVGVHVRQELADVGVGRSVHRRSRIVLVIGLRAVDEPAAVVAAGDRIGFLVDLIGQPLAVGKVGRNGRIAGVAPCIAEVVEGLIVRAAVAGVRQQHTEGKVVAHAVAADAISYCVAARVIVRLCRSDPLERSGIAAVAQRVGQAAEGGLTELLCLALRGEQAGRRKRQRRALARRRGGRQGRDHLRSGKARRRSKVDRHGVVARGGRERRVDAVRLHIGVGRALPVEARIDPVVLGAIGDALAVKFGEIVFLVVVARPDPGADAGAVVHIAVCDGQIDRLAVVVRIGKADQIGAVGVLQNVEAVRALALLAGHVLIVPGHAADVEVRGGKAAVGLTFIPAQIVRAVPGRLGQDVFCRICVVVGRLPELDLRPIRRRAAADVDGIAVLAAHGDELEGLRGLVAELVRRLARDVIDQREIARFFLEHSLLEDGGISADAGGLVRGRAGHVHGVARKTGEIRLAAADRNEVPALRGRAVVLAVKRDRVAVGHGAAGKVNDQPGIRHAEDLIAAVAVGNEVPLLVVTRVRRPAVQIGLIAVFIQRLAAADVQKLEIAAAVAIGLPAAVPLGNARAPMAEQLHAVVARRVVAKQVVPV